MELKKILHTIKSFFREPEYEKKLRENKKHFETLNMGKGEK